MDELISCIKGLVVFYYSVYEEYPRKVFGIVFSFFLVYIFRRLFCKSKGDWLAGQCILAALVIIALQKPFWK